MHQEVYIDIVFAANLLMDYILLRLTGIVLRRKNSRRRCLAAAAVGALFACLNLYVRPGKTGVLTIVLRVVCAVFMIWIAYEIQDVKHMTGAALFFFGMTFLNGGIRKQKSDGCVFFIVCGCDLWRVKSDDLPDGTNKRIQRTYLSGCPEISRTAAGDVWSV